MSFSYLIKANGGTRVCNAWTFLVIFSVFKVVLPDFEKGVTSFNYETTALNSAVNNRTAYGYY